MSRNDAEMTKVTVMDGVSLYNFTGGEVRLPDTITVIVQGKQALLIDAAFPEYSERVKKDLEAREIEVKIIVLSHYHSDHASGCAVFSQCDIYASEFYEHSYNNCRVWEPGYTYIRPTQMIKNGDTLSFGTFNLEFFSAPGHSPCGIITRVSGRVFHVGDLIMMAEHGKASLPFIADGGNFTRHFESLELLKKLDPEIILVPHGGMFDNKNEIAEMIDDRAYYLEKTSSSMGTLPLPACLKNDIACYDYLEFHDTNLMRLL